MTQNVSIEKAKKDTNDIGKDRIVELLQTTTIGHPLYCLETIDSTNSEVKRRSLSENEGTVILSEQQIAGKGRLGRSWISPPRKGIWMSILLKPQLPSAVIPQLTLVAAVAICLALENTEAIFKNKVEIKWPNDILIQGKKVGGILTELQMKGQKVHSVILGMGLNTNLLTNDFPEELKATATSLLIETGKIIERERLIAEILNSFETLYFQFLKDEKLGEALTICRQKSSVIGKEVRLIANNTEIQAEVLDLGSKGELIIKKANGEITSIISGEISLRT